MSIPAYTKTTWANSPDTSSPLSATNLQHIEDQVKAITDASVSGGASPTKLWTDTNTGNDDNPPAPKGINDGLVTNIIGRVKSISTGGYNTALYAPSGGSWVVLNKWFSQGPGVAVLCANSAAAVEDPMVVSGSAQILGALANNYGYAIVWRQS